MILCRKEVKLILSKLDRIIDAHLHFSVKGIFDATAANIGMKCDLQTLEKEFKDNNVVMGIGMGVDKSGEAPNTNPQIIYHGEENFPPFLVQCLGVDPSVITKENAADVIAAFEAKMGEATTVGIKIYTGYQPFFATDDVYKPFYRLAEKYDVPVVFHMGDTANSMGRLKYSHPLIVDDVAVDFPNVRFVIAHCGTPWIPDAVEVASKNKNVYIDLSGLMEGPFEAKAQIEHFKPYLDVFRTWFNYLENYQKLMYGSDWPLVRFKDYIEVIKSIVPESSYEDVFYNNAMRVFSRLQNILK